MLAISFCCQGKYDEADDAFERVIAGKSDLLEDYATLISGYGHLGRTDGVRARYGCLARHSAASSEYMTRSR